MAAGGELIIDDKLLKSIENLEKSLSKITNTSNAVERGMQKWLTQINNSNITDFVSNLNKVAQANEFIHSTLNKLGDKNPYKTLSNDAKNAADNANRLIAVLQQTKAYQVESSAIKNREGIDTLYAEERMRKAIHEELTRTQAQELEHYQRIRNEIRTLESIKKEASKVKNTTEDPELKKDATNTYKEATRQLRYYKEQEKQLRQKYGVEIEQIEKDAAMRGFTQRAKIAKQAADAVAKEIEKEKQLYLKSLNDQALAEQRYQERMQRLQSMRDTVERKVKNSADKDTKKTNETYLKELDKQIQKEQEYQERMRLLKERRAQIGAAAARKVEAEIKAETEAYMKDLERRIKAEQEYLQRMEVIARQKEKMEEISLKRRRAIDAKYGDSSKGALNYSNRLYSAKGVRSIQNMETALNKLRDAQRRLNVGTEEGRKRYAELGAQIKKIEGDLNRVTNASERMKKSHSGLMNTGQQLARQLALVFSVSQIEGYVNKIVQVRKEFELQHKSLQILIGDQSEANKIWTQTVQLAVKSPFRIKELVTYTKQLAAYRIETEQLHDTTKMLADVSAGLGVDMNRLILAYGQVRAAAFLRGTELRQFTEAGIPMLEELANHFSALEGRAVSTADVFERISKRMVMFEDVHAVFKRMTSEGGTFYKMQEKQSETLYGTISNLHDSFDLMMNDIGKSNEGVIKRGLSLVKWLVEHWELVAEAVKATVAAFALYKLHVLQTKTALIDFAIANNIATGNKPLTMLNLLSIGWTKLAKSIKLARTALLSNPITMIVLAAATAAYKLYNAWDLHNEKLKEATKLYRETSAEIAKIDTKFIYGDANERRQRLSALIGKAVKFNIPIDFEVKNLSEEEVEEKFNTIRNQIKSTTAFIAEFNTALAKSDSWTNPFDDINNAFAETSKHASELFLLYERSRASLVSFLKENGKLTDDIKKQLAARGEYDKKETEIEYIERLNKAYDTYLNVVRLSNKAIAKMDVESARQTHKKWAQVWGDEMYNDIIKIRDTMLSYKNSLIDTNKEFEEFAKGLRIPPMSDEQRTVFIKTAIDEKGWDGFTTSLWYKLANEKFSVNITPTIPDKKDTDDWKKRVTAAVQKLNEKIQKELGDNAPKNLFPLPSESDSQESWLNRYKEAIKEIKTVFLDGQKLFDISEVADKNALKPYTREAEIIANIAHKTTKDERDANTILNKRISLIKEIHSAYEKERKLWDKETAEERVLQSYMVAYEDAFGKSISGYNFKIKEGVSSELLELIPLAEKAGKEAMIALERAIASVEVESGDFKKQLADEDLIRQVEKMFGTYELSLELQEMNIPTDIAEKLFGFESIDLDGLRKKLKELEPQFIGTGQEKKHRDYLQKVEEAEQKAYQARIERFYEFLVETTDAIHRVQQEGALDIQFAKQLFEAGKLTVDQYAQAIKSVIASTNEEISKLNLEKFKESPEYIAAMGDMAGYTANELSKLANNIKDLITNSASTMATDEIEAYNNALSKIEAQIRKLKNPFGENWLGKYFQIGKVNDELNAETDKQNTLQTRLNSLLEEEAQLRSKLRQLQYHNAPQEEIDETTNKIKSVNGEIAVVNGKLKTTASNISFLGQKLSSLTEGMVPQIAMVDLIIKGVYNTINGIIQIFNETKELMASFGHDVDTGAWEDVSIIMEGIGETNQKIMDGWESFKNGDVMGAIANTVGSVFSVIKMFNKLFDADLERQIQAEARAVEKLSKAYEQLEKQIDEAYSIDAITKLNDDAQRNLQEQIDSTEKMIALEEEKKDTDQEEIKEYYETLDELKEKQKELAIEQEKALGGIGGQADYKAASEAFVEAWLEAFRETGNGMKGLEEQFDEMLANMVTKQLLGRGVEAMLKPFYQEFDKMFDKDSPGRAEVTSEELDNVGRIFDELAPKLNSNLKRIVDEIGATDDMLNGGELGTLQKGIQGITEDQADILASYLNTIRFIIGENNTYLKTIADNYISTDIENPMLTQMRIVAQQTTAIRDLLDSITAQHPQGGQGLKVVM